MKRAIKATFRLFARVGEKYFSSSQNPVPLPLPQNLRSILWIRLDHIGDGVMSVPSLAALRAKFPHARIDALVLPSFAPLLRELQLADRVIIGSSFRFPDSHGIRGRLSAFYNAHTLAKQLRGQYDLAIDVRGDDVARLIAYWIRTPHRLGVDRIFYEPDRSGNLSFLMTHLTHAPHEPQHAVISNLENLSPLGVTEPPFSWPLTAEQSTSVQKLLDRLEVVGKFAIIQARSNDPQRDWNQQNFAKIAEYLIKEYKFKVLLCGAEKDSPYNEEIISAMESTSNVYNIAGSLPITHLVALFRRARLMVSVDTGPMHLGAMARVPIVSLMLPELVPRHYPWGQPDAPISAPNNQMQEITVEAVKTKINEIMRATNR